MPERTRLLLSVLFLLQYLAAASWIVSLGAYMSKALAPALSTAVVAVLFVRLFTEPRGKTATPRIVKADA